MIEKKANAVKAVEWIANPSPMTFVVFPTHQESSEVCQISFSGEKALRHLLHYRLRDRMYLLKVKFQAASILTDEIV